MPVQNTEQPRDETTLGHSAEMPGLPTTPRPDDQPKHEAANAGKDQRASGRRQRKKPFVL